MRERAILISGLGLFVLFLLMARAQQPHEQHPERGPDARPSEWAFQQRTFPYGQFDKNVYREALAARHALKTASKNGAALGTWEFAGPANVGGRVVDVAFDPETPSTIYAVAATGGVFKSADSGSTWRPIFDDQAILTAGDIAIDPTDTDVLYVGTGEANGGHNNFQGGGLYKSIDGGDTWTFSGLGETDAIGRILIDPDNPQRVFAAAVGSYFAPTPERGVYRSDDGGATWVQKLFVSDSTGAIDLVMHPQDPSIIYAAMWERVRRPETSHLSGPTSGLYRSTDGGDTWVELGPDNGLPDPDRQAVGRIGLAISQSNPEILYALYNDGFNYLGLYKTEDGGATWIDADPGKFVTGGTAGFSWYFGQVRIHPENPDIVYALDVAFMRSEDGGVSWKYLNDNNIIHVDQHAMAFHPDDPDVILVGNDGGVYTASDGGLVPNRGLRGTWRKTGGLPITQFYEIEIDPNFPDRLYGGTQDNWTVRTFGGPPETWEGVRNAFGAGGDGFYVIVAEENSDFIYVESQYGNIQKSSDGGLRFSQITFGIAPLYDGPGAPANAEPRNWSTPVAIDPNNSAVFYYGTNRIYRAETRGTFWNPISEPLTDWRRGTFLGTISTIAVAPTNSDVIYAGTDDGHVWVSSDYGATWEDISAGLPYRWVTRVVVDPTDEDIVYATFSGLKWHDPQPHVFRSTNRGVTWTDISSNLPDVPVNAFAVDPIDTDRLYLGADVGAFVSFDAGGSWEVLGKGMPAAPVYDLKVQRDGAFLLAGTHGRSMFTLNLARETASERLPQRPQFSVAANYPNPFKSSTTIRYEVEQSSPIRLTVYDLLGREVNTLVDDYRGPGIYTATWDGRDGRGRPVASGTYLYTLTVPGEGATMKTRQMVYVR